MSDLIDGFRHLFGMAAKAGLKAFQHLPTDAGHAVEHAVHAVGAITPNEALTAMYASSLADGEIITRQQKHKGYTIVTTNKGLTLAAV